MSWIKGKYWAVDRLFKIFSKAKPFKFDREEIYKKRIEKIMKEGKDDQSGET